MSNIPLHENTAVCDYIATRVFDDFTLSIKDEKIIFETDSNTINRIFELAKIVSKKPIDFTKLMEKRKQIIKVITENRWDSRGIKELLEAIAYVNSFCDEAVKQRIEDGAIHYEDLPVVFRRGVEVIAQTHSGMFGGIVEECFEQVSFFGNYTLVKVSIIVNTTKGCNVAKTSIRINDFSGTRMLIKNLNLRPITEKEKADLTERGKIFREFAEKPILAAYKGNLFIPDYYGEKSFCADGRVMVDVVNFAQLESDLYYRLLSPFDLNDNDGDETERGNNTIKDDELWLCYSRVPGFSMRLKQWGWLQVDALTSVKWRDDAFEQLVLSEEHKMVIYNLVKHYGSSFSDFIEGKSGGLVFLLKGKTGTGKTLTAEAVAETLHRPLYSVSVGELGISPEELETRLRNILDVAHQWNAVLLLDEADIFMEARDSNNIERNAMVSIFLRLLEYYSGVLFLTTNRATSFDPAFYSRISLAINYPKLDGSNREGVWHNILLTAGVATEETVRTQFDLQRLGDFNVNGRNIKTAVRMAQTIAISQNRSVEQADLEKFLSLTAKFNEEVGI